VEEVRKAIEVCTVMAALHGCGLNLTFTHQVHEAEEAADESRRMAEIEALVKQRIADAVSECTTTVNSRAVQLVMLMRELPRMHTAASSEEESALLAEVTATFQDGDQGQIASTVELFLAGQGNCEY